MKRPFEISEELYPFESHWKEIDGHQIHYLDEGPENPKLTIVFFHGNPTWSLLYAGIIQKLRDRYRCIAPDYPGFGMSSKPEYPDYGYTPAEHAAVMKKFIRELGLKKFSIFVQDWGGPIGLDTATEYADSIEQIFIGNTWAWPFEPGTPMGDSAQQFSQKMGGDDMLDKIQKKNTFLSISIPLLLRGIRNRNPELRGDLKEAYLAPFSTEKSRIPTWVFPREIMKSYDFLKALKEKLPSLTDKPAILFWGEKDLVFPVIVRDEWESLLKNYRRVDFPDASHFFQEEKPDEIAAEIQKNLE